MSSRSPLESLVPLPASMSPHWFLISFGGGDEQGDALVGRPEVPFLE